jgi:hypothetical protein
MDLMDGYHPMPLKKELVLRDCPCAAVYDIIVGSRGSSVEELVTNHTPDILKVLNTFAPNNM